MKSDCVARLEYVLQEGLPVLYYNGQNDVIVCTPCTEVWLDRINYSGNIGGKGVFYNAYFDSWNATINDVSQVVGYNKTSDNLWFYTINKAGHMVGLHFKTNFFGIKQIFIFIKSRYQQTSQLQPTQWSQTGSIWYCSERTVSKKFTKNIQC